MQPDVHDLFSDKTPDILIPNRIRSPWDFSAEPSLIVDNPHPLNLPQMAPRTRSSAKIQTVESYQASGSEYSESPKAMDIDDLEEPPAQSPEPSVEYAKTSKGRRVVKKSYAESADSDDEDFQGDGLEADGPGVPPDPPAKDTVPEDHNRTRYSLRTRRSQIIISDEDDEGPATRYQTRNKKKLQPSEEINGTTSGRLSRRNSSRKRKSAKPRQSAREQHDEDGYVDASSDASADAEGSLDGDARTSSDLDLDDPAGAIVDGDDDAEQEESQDNRYSFRQRAKVNYAIPPPLEEMAAPSQKKSALGRTNGRGGTLGGKRAKPPGWSATGAELSRWMGGGAGDDSVRVFPFCFPVPPHVI